MFFRCVEIASYYSYPWRAELGRYSGPDSYQVFGSIHFKYFSVSLFLLPHLFGSQKQHEAVQMERSRWFPRGSPVYSAKKKFWIYMDYCVIASLRTKYFLIFIGQKYTCALKWAGNFELQWRQFPTAPNRFGSGSIQFKSIARAKLNQDRHVKQRRGWREGSTT